jgi:hypothetical protein
MKFILTIIGVYALIESKDMEIVEFYNKLQEVIDKTNNNEYLIIGGDFNARVGNQPIDQNIGFEGEPTLNNNGELLRNVFVFNNLKITNTFYRHKDIHKHTWEAHSTKSLIDCVIINDKLEAYMKNTRVYHVCQPHTKFYPTSFCQG